MACVFLQVYKLSIGAVCALTWPPDRIIIQVLDDSTDPIIKVSLDCSDKVYLDWTKINVWLSSYWSKGVMFMWNDSYTATLVTNKWSIYLHLNWNVRRCTPSSSKELPLKYLRCTFEKEIISIIQMYRIKVWETWKYRKSMSFNEYGICIWHHNSVKLSRLHIILSMDKVWVWTGLAP
jgi:hypothetical protein